MEIDSKDRANLCENGPVNQSNNKNAFAGRVALPRDFVIYTGKYLTICLQEE